MSEQKSGCAYFEMMKQDSCYRYSTEYGIVGSRDDRGNPENLMSWQVDLYQSCLA